MSDHELIKIKKYVRFLNQKIGEANDSGNMAKVRDLSHHVQGVMKVLEILDVEDNLD